MTTDIDLEDGSSKQLSVRIPNALLARVDMAGSHAGCKNRTQAAILVLEQGLEALDRQKIKPHRLEKVCGRIEWLAATILAYLWIALPEVAEKKVAEKRRDIFKILEGLR